MPSRNRHKQSALKRIALPVLSGSIIRPGQRIHVVGLPDQDPRLFEALPKSVYGILDPFELAPTFFDDFLSIKISNEEEISLSQVLGAELTQEAHNDLQVIIKRFVSAIALSDRLPTWKAYQRRLHEIDQRADELLRAARQFIKITRTSHQDPPCPPGVLSLEQSVKHYLRAAGGDYDLQLDLTSVRRVCKRALKRIAPLATKRGRKGDVNFHLFVEALFHVARLCGARTSLPSGQIKEKGGPDRRTQFFNFVRATLELTIEKGCAAIQRADLSEAEKEAALRILRQANKTDGGLLEDLRRAAVLKELSRRYQDVVRKRNDLPRGAATQMPVRSRGSHT